MASMKPQCSVSLTVSMGTSLRSRTSWRTSSQLARPASQGTDCALAAELPNALKFNRKLWTVFVTSVTDNESQLPLQVRENVANLGIFVLSQTAELQIAPTPEKLDPLVRINRHLAAGLRGSPG